MSIEVYFEGVCEYIYIYIYLCVCVCVWGLSAHSRALGIIRNGTSLYPTPILGTSTLDP